MTPADERARLISILKKHAVPGCKVDIEQEAALMQQQDAFARICDLPRASAVSTKQALDELQRLHSLAVDLCQHIHRMSRTALAHVDRQKPGRHHPLLLADSLARLAHTAQAATARLSRRPRCAKTGARAKETARVRTMVAAATFKKITERKAAGKPFERFLADFFDAISETASVKGQVEKWKKTRKNI